MLDVLEGYELAKQGTPVPETMVYGEMNVLFNNSMVHLFDSSGHIPLGAFPLPRNESQFEAFLDERNNLARIAFDDGHFICYGCHELIRNEDEDKPSLVKDKANYCRKCAGKVVEQKTAEAKVEETKENIPSTKEFSKADPKKIIAAIKFLHENGYKVKMIAKSFKVVYVEEGSTKEGISETYHPDLESFKKDFPNRKPIALIKELVSEQEKDI